jgi:hypothetical protein
MDDIVFSAELPFKPEEGEYLIISGIKEDGTSKEVVCKIDGLIYDTVRGNWTMNPRLISWHIGKVEQSENKTEYTGLEL